MYRTTRNPCLDLYVDNMTTLPPKPPRVSLPYKRHTLRSDVSLTMPPSLASLDLETGWEVGLLVLKVVTSLA